MCFFVKCDNCGYKWEEKLPYTELKLEDLWFILAVLVFGILNSMIYGFAFLRIINIYEQLGLELPIFTIIVTNISRFCFRAFLGIIFLVLLVYYLITNHQRCIKYRRYVYVTIVLLLAVEAIAILHLHANIYFRF